MAGIGTSVKEPGLFNQVELHISARNIQDRDLFSTSDPFCVLYQKKLGSEEFVETDRTETIKDTVNPDFVKKFKVNYFDQEVQELKFEFFDEDSPSKDLSRHDALGEVLCTLKEIVESRRIERPILYKGKERKRDYGTICITLEDVGDSNDVVTLQFQATELDKMDTFGKSDPYLTFYRTNRDKSTTIVYRSEVIKKTLNPTWQEFTIPLRTLCANDYSRPIAVTCWDWNKTGSDEYAGECEISMDALKDGPLETVYKIIKLDKDDDKHYDNSGKLRLVKCDVEKRHSFHDYIRSGVSVHFTLAIDFSMARDKHSLCENVLMSLDQSLEYFNSDDDLTLLRLRTHSEGGANSSEFLLNNSPLNCSRVDDVIEAFKQEAQNVLPLCCTGDVTSAIEHIKKQANNNEGTIYHVVLLFTDTFSESVCVRTKEALQDIRSLPMSLIVLGFGEYSASASQNTSTVWWTDLASRDSERTVDDMLQYVHIQDFVDQNNQLISKERLARDVFRKLPEQFLKWAKLNGVEARCPQNGD